MYVFGRVYAATYSDETEYFHCNSEYNGNMGMDCKKEDDKRSSEDLVKLHISKCFRMGIGFTIKYICFRWV